MVWFNIVKIAEVEQVGADLLNYIRELAEFFDDFYRFHLVMRELLLETERERPEVLEEIRRELGNIGDAEIQRATDIVRQLLTDTVEKGRDVVAILEAEEINVDALYYELTQNRWQDLRQFLEGIPQEMLEAIDREQLPPMPDIERMMEIVDMFREPEDDWTKMTDQKKIKKCELLGGGVYE